MKNLLLLFVSLLISAPSWAQGLKADTAIMGAGYANQVYYDFANRTKKMAQIQEWDIAHTTVGRDNCIRANHMTGLRVVAYAKGNANAFDTFGTKTKDTMGWASWRMIYNDYHNHDLGAFNQQNNGATWDFSWGVYDPTSHVVTGDSLYLLAFVNGAGAYTKFLKFRPISQEANGDLVFKFANLDGTGAKQDTLFQATGAKRMYKYYKFSNSTKPVHEPADSTWDISFNRYYSLQFNPATSKYEMYPTMGVESKRGTLSARVFGTSWSSVQQDTGGLVWKYQKAFKNDLTGIGSDWKSFNGSTYDFKDTQSYIVKRVRVKDTSYWLIHFTGFTGSSSGTTYFNTQKLRNSVSVKTPELGIVSIFPNPAKDFLYITLEAKTMGAATVKLLSSDGRQISINNLESSGSGLDACKISVKDLAAGTYFIQVSNNKGTATRSIIIE